MTLQDLYNEIDGDYDQAVRVLRVDKLSDEEVSDRLKSIEELYKKTSEGIHRYVEG